MTLLTSKSELDFGSTGRIDPPRRVTLTEAEIRPQTATVLGEVETLGRPLEHDPYRRAYSWATMLVEQFRDLPQGWDSYGAEPVDPGAADLAVQVLAGLLAIPGLTPPQAAPSPDGGVSIEWHLRNVDFVISIGPGDVPPSAFFADSHGEWEIEDLRRADDRLSLAINALTVR